MKIVDSSVKTCAFTLTVESGTAPDFIDITDEIVKFVKLSQISNGIVVVYSKHTTAAITIQEAEPLLLKDMINLLERLVPPDSKYGHNDFSIRTVHMHENECPNGHSHCQHLILGTSETIPVIDNQLTLGEWQRIFMIELDPERDRRDVLVQIMGA